MEQSIYTAALYAVFMVLALQLVLVALGLSDIEADVEADPTGGFDIPDDLEIQSAGAATMAAETVDAEVVSVAASTGIAGVLGLRGVPLLVWLCFALSGFGGAGLILPDLLPFTARFETATLLVSATCGVLLARIGGRLFRAIVPALETSAVDIGIARRLRGVVTHGRMTDQRPARVLVKDRFGGSHHLMATPFDAGEEIIEGSSVLLLRVMDHDSGTHAYKALRLP